MGFRPPTWVFLVAGGLLLVGITLLFEFSSPSGKLPPAPPPERPPLTESTGSRHSPGSAARRVPPPPPVPFPERITELPFTAESLRLNDKAHPPSEDLQILQSMLEEYRRALRENPGGENAEIVAALQGRNVSGAAVLATNHPAVRADGQLVDRWGTPYYFHPVSRTVTEVMSAGPDGRLWTDDDVVQK